MLQFAFAEQPTGATVKCADALDQGRTGLIQIPSAFAMA